jgi:hypothetical protein
VFFLAITMFSYSIAFSVLLTLHNQWFDLQIYHEFSALTCKNCKFWIIWLIFFIVKITIIRLMVIFYFLIKITFPVKLEDLRLIL